MANPTNSGSQNAVVASADRWLKNIAVGFKHTPKTTLEHATEFAQAVIDMEKENKALHSAGRTLEAVHKMRINELKVENAAIVLGIKSPFEAQVTIQRTALEAIQAWWKTGDDFDRIPIEKVDAALSTSPPAAPDTLQPIVEAARELIECLKFYDDLPHMHVDDLIQTIAAHDKAKKVDET